MPHTVPFAILHDANRAQWPLPDHATCRYTTEEEEATQPISPAESWQSTSPMALLTCMLSNLKVMLTLLLMFSSGPES